MTSLSFVISPTPGFTGFLRRRNALVSFRSRQPQICRQEQRIRIACENLYPEVDPPESIPNPLKQNKQPGEPDDSREPFLKRLNDKTEQRQARDTSARNLDASTPETDSSMPETDPSTPEADSASAQVAGVVDYTSASLSPEPTVQKTSNYKGAARAFWRLGWFAWWVQLILSVISGVILLFSFAAPGVNIRSSASAFGFILSGVGVLIAFISLFWTYSYTRLSLWLERGNGTAERARLRINSRLRFGLLFSIAGLLVSLVGLQAIVGNLLARLFSAGIATTPYTAYQAGGTNTAGGLIPGMGIVQPVDILIVQACANTMLSLLTALMITTWLRSREKAWNKRAEVQ